MWSHFGKPDYGLHRFDLTEEGADVAESVMPPVFEEPSRFRRHLRLADRQRAPNIHMLTDLVDDRSDVVLLVLRRESLTFVEDQLFLFRSLFSLLRFGNRRNEFCPSAGIEDALGWLSGRVQLPMLLGVLVR